MFIFSFKTKRGTGTEWYSTECTRIPSPSQNNGLEREKSRSSIWIMHLIFIENLVSDCSSGGLEREQPDLWGRLGFREPGLVSDQFPGGQAGQEQKSRKMRQINPKAEKSATRLGNILLLKTFHHSYSSQGHLKKCGIPFWTQGTLPVSFRGFRFYCH